MSADSNRDARILELLSQADQMPREKQREWLEKHCPKELLDEVMSWWREEQKESDRSDTGGASGSQLWKDTLIGCESRSKYRIEKPVDDPGNMGDVYLAKQVTGDGPERNVAVKVLPWMSPVNARRFLRERRILFNLRLDGVVRAIDAGRLQDGRPFYVMEWVEGGVRLDTYCRRHALSLEKRLELFREICAIVHRAHSLPGTLIHRDLKPANILVDQEGRPTLLDFGLAKLLHLDATLTQPGPGVGTPAYMSPEQDLGGFGQRPVTAASDQYSLCVLLFEMLTEQLPLQASKRHPIGTTRPVPVKRPSRATGFRDPIRKLVPRRKLWGDLNKIVLKALAYDPADRFASVAELDDAIHKRLKGIPVDFTKPSFLRRVRSFARARPAVATSFLMLPLSLAAAGGVHVNETQKAAELWADHDRHDLEARANKDLQFATLMGRYNVERARADRLEHDAASHMLADGHAERARRQYADLNGVPASIHGQIVKNQTVSIAPPLIAHEVKGDRLLIDRNGGQLFVEEAGATRRAAGTETSAVFDGTFVPALDGEHLTVGFGPESIAGVGREGMLSFVAASTMTANGPAVTKVAGRARGGSVDPTAERLSLVDDDGLLIVDKQGVVQRHAGITEAHWVSPALLLATKGGKRVLLDPATRELTEIPELIGSDAIAVGPGGIIAAMWPGDTLLFDTAARKVIGALREPAVAAAFAPSGGRIAILRTNGQISTLLLDATVAPREGSTVYGVRHAVTTAVPRRVGEEAASSGEGMKPRLSFSGDGESLLVSWGETRLLGASSLEGVRTFEGLEQRQTLAMFYGDDDRIAAFVRGAGGAVGSVYITEAGIESGRTRTFERMAETFEFTADGNDIVAGTAPPVTAAAAVAATSPATAASGCVVATAQADGSVLVTAAGGWGSELVRLEGLDAPAEEIRLHPESMVVAARSKGRVRVWNLGVIKGTRQCRVE